MRDDWIWDSNKVAGNGGRKSYNTMTKFGKGMVQVGDAILGVIRGFADWIGMGDKVTTWIDKATGEVDMNKVRTELSARIQKVLNQGDIDLSQLEDKVAQLEGMGIALTGKARSMITKELRKAKDQVAKQKAKNKEVAYKATNIQNTIDTKLKSLTESGDVADSMNVLDVQNQVEKEIGELENV